MQALSGREPAVVSDILELFMLRKIAVGKKIALERGLQCIVCLIRMTGTSVVTFWSVIMASQMSVFARLMYDLAMCDDSDF